MEVEHDIMKSQMVTIRSAKNVYDFYQKANRIHFISDQILILIWTKLVGLKQMIVQAKVEKNMRILFLINSHAVGMAVV